MRYDNMRYRALLWGFTAGVRMLVGVRMLLGVWMLAEHGLSIPEVYGLHSVFCVLAQERHSLITE